MKHQVLHRLLVGITLIIALCSTASVSAQDKNKPLDPVVVTQDIVIHTASIKSKEHLDLFKNRLLASGSSVVFGAYCEKYELLGLRVPTTLKLDALAQILKSETGLSLHYQKPITIQELNDLCSK